MRRSELRFHGETLRARANEVEAEGAFAWRETTTFRAHKKGPRRVARHLRCTHIGFAVQRIGVGGRPCASPGMRRPFRACDGEGTSGVGSSRCAKGLARQCAPLRMRCEETNLRMERASGGSERARSPWEARCRHAQFARGAVQWERFSHGTGHGSRQTSLTPVTPTRDSGRCRGESSLGKLSDQTRFVELRPVRSSLE